MLDTKVEKNVFPNVTDLDNMMLWYLSNLDLNELLLELVTFDDGDLPKGLSSTLAYVDLGLNIDEEEEEGRTVVLDIILMILRTTDSDKLQGFAHLWLQYLPYFVFSIDIWLIFVTYFVFVDIKWLNKEIALYGSNFYFMT